MGLVHRLGLRGQGLCKIGRKLVNALAASAKLGRKGVYAPLIAGNILLADLMSLSSHGCHHGSFL
jgi:hypothetical protein